MTDRPAGISCMSFRQIGQREVICHLKQIRQKKDIHIWVSRPKYKMCMGFSEVYQWNGD